MAQLTSSRCWIPVRIDSNNTMTTTNTSNQRHSYFTRKKAHEYGITGWCRNTHDHKASRGPLLLKLSLVVVNNNADP